MPATHIFQHLFLCSILTLIKKFHRRFTKFTAASHFGSKHRKQQFQGFGLFLSLHAGPVGAYARLVNWSKNVCVCACVWCSSWLSVGGGDTSLTRMWPRGQSSFYIWKGLHWSNMVETCAHLSAYKSRVHWCRILCFPANGQSVLLPHREEMPRVQVFSKQSCRMTRFSFAAAQKNSRHGESELRREKKWWSLRRPARGLRAAQRVLVWDKKSSVHGRAERHFDGYGNAAERTTGPLTHQTHASVLMTR